MQGCIDRAANAVRTCCTVTLLCANHFGVIVRALNDAPDGSVRCVKCNLVHIPGRAALTAVIPL